MRFLVRRKPGDKPEPKVVLTPKDRLVVAIVSLVMLIFLVYLTFGAIRVLHAGLIGWFAILVVIYFAIVTINIILFLSGSHLNHFHERTRLRVTHRDISRMLTDETLIILFLDT